VTADPPQAGEEDPPPGLFGAPEAGAFRPTPLVYINGAPVAAAMPAAWRRGENRQVVIDGVTVTWGREEILDQPDPPTGSLQLFDASGSWATSRDLRGLTVDLFWAGPHPVTGDLVTRAYFRGRIGSPVRVSSKTVVTPAGETVTGSLVNLPLVSVLVDPANRTPTAAWPAEPLGARRTRVEAALADTLPGGVETRAYWHTPEVAPVAAKDQISLYDHLVALYDSSGADRLTYLPDGQRTTFVARRDYWTTRGHGRLWWNLPGDGTGSARAGKGVYARAIGNPTVYQYLDAAALEYPDDAGITSPDKITQVRLTHPDGATGYSDRTVELAVDGTSEARDGIRTASVDSIVAWASWADVAASDLEELAQKEAAEWRLEPFIWHTRMTGGFESYEQAVALLEGGETQLLFFLQRSFLPGYGVRPIFGVMGQTITYSDRGWELECQVAPLTTTLPQHPITWDEFDDGSAGYQVRWYDGDHPNGMHESLTYEDLGWVSLGLGPNTMAIGPDQGWDFLP